MESWLGLLLPEPCEGTMHTHWEPPNTCKRGERNMKTVRVLAILTLATCAFAAAANAQSVTAKFTLPYEVHWGTATLPAGEYAISMDLLHTAITLVQSASNNVSFFTRIPVMENSSKSPASLVITSFNGDRRVRSLNLPELGKSFVYERITTAEREQIAKGRVQIVPVSIARK
jgi:hypothetical protein